MQLKIFNYIDQVIEYKHELRFEIDEAKKVIDQCFQSIYEDNERFTNYSSRIKEDESLKEKIIRQNYHRLYKTPAEIFDHMSDIIGCRVECRFMNDEAHIYKELFNHFTIENSDGYYKSEINPNLEMKLSQDQPLIQKNGTWSYRVDGRYLGKRVLNFELQIKSFVNVFWNEIDHKILYKNYNYVVTKDFIREMMTSIRNDLTNIDKQLENVYNQLQSLNTSENGTTPGEIKSLTGEMLQDVYLTPLRNRSGLVFDFRSSIDLITSFLFERVEYESRESLASEFIRIMDEAHKSEPSSLEFGQLILFDPPISYYNISIEKLGEKVEEEMNVGIVWNLIIRILFDLNEEDDDRYTFTSFIDYLYFLFIKLIREAFARYDYAYDDYEGLIEILVDDTINACIQDLQPDYFLEDSLKRLEKHTNKLLEMYKNEEIGLADIPYAYREELHHWMSKQPNHYNMQVIEKGGLLDY